VYVVVAGLQTDVPVDGEGLRLCELELDGEGLLFRGRSSPLELCDLLRDRFWGGRGDPFWDDRDRRVLLRGLR